MLSFISFCRFVDSLYENQQYNIVYWISMFLFLLGDFFLAQKLAAIYHNLSNFVVYSIFYLTCVIFSHLIRPSNISRNSFFSPPPPSPPWRKYLKFISPFIFSFPIGRRHHSIIQLHPPLAPLSSFIAIVVGSRHDKKRQKYNWK